MSDTPLGPDWWRASNGLYYPPEARPGQPPPDATTSDTGDRGGDDLSSMPAPPDDEPTATTTTWDDEPEPADDEAGSRRWLVPALIIVALLAVLAGAGVWWMLSDDDDDDTASAATTTTTTDDTDTTDTTAAGDTTTTTEDTGEVSVYDLGVGDCFDTTETEGSDGLVVSTVVLTECDEPHGAEVYAIEAIEAADTDPFPGADARDQAARELCEAGFEDFVGVSTAESELVLLWLAPTEESWEEGDREVTCAVAAPEGERLTESVAGSER